MVTKRYLSIALVTVVLLFSVFYWRNRFKPDAPPAPSVQKFFSERAATAEGYLTSPVGAALRNKDWKFLRSRQLDPGAGQELAEVTRSMFIDVGFSDWTPGDYDLLFDILLSASIRAAGSEQEKIIAQLDRLPTPSNGSPVSDRLRRLLGSGQSKSLSLLAAKKLAIQDLSPTPADLSRALPALMAAPKNKGEPNPLLMIDEARSPEAKKYLLQGILPRLKQLHPEHYPSTLYLLSRNIEIIPSAYEKIYLLTRGALQSQDPVRMEYGLRNIVFLNAYRKLSGTEVARIVSLLTSIPSHQQTPFIREKSKEIISLLER